MDLIDRLYQKIKEDPLSPKMLIVPSYSQGHQLLERMCERFGSVFNVEVETLQGMVHANTAFELSRRKIRFLEDEEAFWVIRQLMLHQAEADPHSYITHQSMLNPGVVRKVHQSLVELRLAGVRSGDIHPKDFSNESKGLYLQQLLDRYEAYLKEQALTDFAGLAEYCSPTADNTRFLLLQPAGWSRMEWDLIEKIAGSQLDIVNFDEPFYSHARFSNNRLMMFRAAGSLAEVREGFRRMIAETEPLDQMEIMLSDYERYASVLYSQAEASGVPCTFSNGLPISYCTAGKAALAILAWIKEGFPVTRLTEMLRSGCLQIADHQASAGDWIRLLEQSGIGWGRHRYAGILDSRQSMGDGQQELGMKLHEVLQGWFDKLPEGSEWRPDRLLEWLGDFVEKHVPLHSSDDQNVKTAIQAWSTRLSGIRVGSMTPEWAVRYVTEILNGIRIRVDATPRPGAVHVTSIHNGGFSGRYRTWIVGMDERAWSMPIMQDPLLLDEERTAVSTHLQLVREQAKQIRNARDARLSLICGELWLSYASYDPGEREDRSPAFEMLQIMRLQSGDDTQDFSALERVLGQPYSVMDVLHPEERRSTYDEIDVWAQYLRDSSGTRDGWKAVSHAYPALAQGYLAQVNRQDERLSVYDGWLSTNKAGSDGILGQQAISVSQLEKYAACGLQYYFYSVLKLRPKEIPVFDRARWLQADERGTLLHHIYRLYLEEVTEFGTKPPQHDKRKLHRIVDQALDDAAKSIPAPSPHVQKKECEEIRRDAEVFYRNEEGKTEQPCYFELELGTAEGEPMELTLPDGMQVKLKGFVDRVDRIGPHEYRIIDYKTGNMKKYASAEYFSGGTQLQHALYSIAVEQWLHLTGKDIEARVMEAEYAFPTVRGRGEYVRRKQDRREELGDIISKLLDSMNQGLFIPAKDVKTCMWCKYQSVCGSHAEWMGNKRGAAVNAAVLGSLREVEEID